MRWIVKFIGTVTSTSIVLEGMGRAERGQVHDVHSRRSRLWQDLGAEEKMPYEDWSIDLD